MNNVRRIGLALVVGLIAIVSIRSVDPAEITLEPRDKLWRRSVSGATPSGRVFDHAIIRLPGLRRSEPGRIVVCVDGARVELRIGVDDGRVLRMRTNREGEVAIELPPVLGDVLAVALLLWIFRRERARGLVLAAVYWALPVSWLSSAVVGLLSVTYVLNMLCLEGLGRFYGARYMAFEALIGSAAGLRMAFGFDLTLLLAVVNVALFAAFLVSIRKHG